MNAQSRQSGINVNRSMPPGTIIPELVYGDVGADVDRSSTITTIEDQHGNTQH